MADYANPDPIFQPAMRIVSAITNANPAQVTTTFAHQYITGTIVRLYVPPNCGMNQINHLEGEIVVNSPTTFLIDIDTTLFDPFAIPDPIPYGFTYPQVVPTGEINAILTAATQNVLP